MCGVAGYCGRQPLDPERIRATLATLRHRGPDDAAHKAFAGPGGWRVELLHTRLSIIDLDTRANQPLNVGGLWIAYNGELYNYVELRARLRRAGVHLRTESDTEVLLAAIERLGWDALDDCEGMWAFAAYDEDRQTLTLARDRFGEKPLYLLRRADGLYFGSEAKTVFALAGERPRANERQLYRYLVNGYKSLYKTPETFFQDLEELPAGSLLHITPAGETPVRYWEPPAPAEDASMTFEQAVEGTRERLLRSMQLRLRADVPVAFCMSGGVDSLTLIAAAKKVFGYDVHGFTIVTDDPRYDERELVEHAVDRLSLRHTSVQLETAGFLPRLRDLVRAHHAPIYTISYYIQWLLMETIRDAGYRVAVSGTGADELFTGYYDHHLAYLYETRASPQAAAARANWERHISPIVRNPFLGDPELFIHDPGFRDHIFLGADEFARYLRRDFREQFHEQRFTDNLLRNRMLNELFAEAVPVILHEDDLNAMFFSIENRSPYLDRELFEFSLTIPTRHLIRDGRAKAILREAGRDIVPDAILDNRRKVGFNAPIHSLLDSSDPEVREYLLADGPLFEHVRREKLEPLLDAETLPNSESKMLFNLVNAKIFLEEVAA